MQTSTKTLADGKLELTVIKFEAMRGFTLLGRLQQPGAQQDPGFLREILSSSYVIRTDEQGNKEKIDLNGDAAINKAFRGCSMMALMDAQAFALEVNFGDFFAEAGARVQAKAASANP